MKKYKLHRDLIEAFLITVGIIIAFSALAFTSVNKPVFVDKKVNALHATKLSLENTTTLKIRLYDEKGNLLLEENNIGASLKLPSKAQLVMSLDGIDYYMVIQ